MNFVDYVAAPTAGQVQPYPYARLNDETKKHAYNHGIAWSDDDVSMLLNLIDKDETTYQMAMALGRTFYAAQVARSHVAFASRHARVFKKYL